MRGNGDTARHGEPGKSGPASIETFWQVRGASGYVFACAVYQTIVGLELRVGPPNEVPISIAVVRDIDDARHRAENLKRMMLEQGAFTEVPLETPH